MLRAIADPRLRIGMLLMGAGLCLRVATALLLRMSFNRVMHDLAGMLAQSLLGAVVMFASYCAAAYCVRKARGSAVIDFFNLLALAIFGRAVGGLLYYLVLHFAPADPLVRVPAIAQYVIEMAIFARLFSWRLREVLVFAAFVLVGTLLVFGAIEGVSLLLLRG
jgi:hypothetical protein